MSSATYQRVIARQAARIEKRLIESGDTCDVYTPPTNGIANPGTGSPIAAGVPCDVAAVSMLTRPEDALTVYQMGYDPRQFRWITVPLSFLTAHPTVGVNWALRVRPGLSNQQDYNIVEAPHTDETKPLMVVLGCIPLGPTESGA